MHFYYQTMTKKQERHTIATVGTVMFLILLFLLLWFVYLSAPIDKEEEGIEIAFGEVEEAGGYTAEPSEAVPLPAPEPVAPASTPSDNELLTQEDEEALALQRAEKEKKAREEKEHLERLEAERKAREAREAAEAAERAKQAEAIAKAEAMGSLFGDKGDDNGSGTSQGAGQQGNPIGHGTSGGNDWSLAGRNIKGTLPPPANTHQQEGKLIVEIRVNAAGQVVNATVKGGNISDKATQQLALEAARKAKFTEGDHDQIGTITYNFKFN